MNHRNRWLLVILSLMLVLTVLPLHAALGFGDFDSGSDSDSGGSDSSSDWSDRSSRSDRSSGSSGKGGSGWIAVLLAIPCCLLGYGVIFLDNRHKEKKAQEAREKAQERRRLAWNELKQRDPDFNKDALIRHVKTLFNEMQTTWEAGNIEPVQYGFTPDAWNRFDTQLQMKNARGEVTHVRDIDIVSVDFVDIRLGEEKEQLLAEIVSAYNVWVTNSKGKVIQFSPSTRHKMIYLWTLERPAGAKTPASGLTDRKHCPNCGAELDVAAFAECPFCKAQIGGEWTGWLLSDIRLRSQETLHK